MEMTPSLSFLLLFFVFLAGLQHPVQSAGSIFWRNIGPTLPMRIAATLTEDLLKSVFVAD
jgi:hypothetical protein